MDQSIPRSRAPKHHMRNVRNRDKRHCWECRRRYLVCGSEMPSCKRCCAAGIPCPGYGDTKPTRLKWRSPKKVTSHDQARKADRNEENHVETTTTKSTPDSALPGNDIQGPIQRFYINEEAYTITIQALEYCMLPLKPAT